MGISKPSLPTWNVFSYVNRVFPPSGVDYSILPFSEDEITS